MAEQAHPAGVVALISLESGPYSKMWALHASTLKFRIGNRHPFPDRTKFPRVHKVFECGSNIAQLRRNSETLTMGMSMRQVRSHAVLVAAMSLPLNTVHSAYADALVRTAQPGKTTRMFVYTSWNKDCSSKTGVVRVVAKPRHGTLIPHRDVDTTIGRNRVKPNDSCYGMPTKGFQVDYTSKPGYRGTDSFVIEATFGTQATIVDTFTVIVE